jgi:hypothetical protein
LKGKTPTRIKNELYSVYGDLAPSFTTVIFKTAEFKRGRMSFGDDASSGNITKVHQIVLNEHRINVREVAEDMSL